MAHRYFLGKTINLLIIISIVFLSACVSGPDTESASESKNLALISQESQMNELAVAFVKLALALGEHDSDYVDAYHGPKQWREQAKNMALSLQQIQSQSTQHASALNKLSMEDGSAKKRGQFLSKGFHSLQTRAAIVAGKALALGERVEKFRKDFIIPAEKLDFVFQAAFSAA